jgi:hypothetical protein
MKSKLSTVRITSRKTPTTHLRATYASRLLQLLLMTVPAVGQADWYSTNNNGTITITRYTGPGGAVTIPSTVNGLPVTSIGSQAFYNRSNVTSVTIPDSVTSIGNNAFDSCTKLTNVTVGASVASIGAGAFYGCSALGTIAIPTNVTTIGDSAFRYCTRLTSITIPNSVTNLGAWTFAYCLNLTNVTIPKRITGIGEAMFKNCTALSRLTIGDNITSIGDTAFFNCYRLTTMTLPSSVTNLGAWAFSYCNSLTALYFQGNAPSLARDALYNASKVAVYYLPGTTGWGPTFGGRPPVLWNVQVPTSDASFGVRTNQFGFTITGTRGLVIVVEACTDLVNPLWTPVGTNVLFSGSSYFSDPQWTNYPARLYRLRSP